MENDKYKILVLSDLKRNSSTTLKNSVSLAKMIDADLQLFHVKKHTEIVTRENQLSAMRSINEAFIKTKNKIIGLIDPVSKSYDIDIDYNFSFGNLKDEIRNSIKNVKPDIIVLGQKDTKPLKLVGDSITSFILKEFDGIVMISSPNNVLEPNEKMTLGVLNGSKKIFDTKMSKNLVSHTSTPLKSFKVVDFQSESKPTSTLNEEKMVEYVFEKNANTITTLSSYLLKSKINLLCVDRNKNETKNITNTTTPLKQVVGKLDVSLLVSRA